MRTFPFFDQLLVAFSRPLANLLPPYEQGDVKKARHCSQNTHYNTHVLQALGIQPRDRCKGDGDAEAVPNESHSNESLTSYLKRISAYTWHQEIKDTHSLVAIDQDAKSDVTETTNPETKYGTSNTRKNPMHALRH
jgi:hypothetical protein